MSAVPLKNDVDHAWSRGDVLARYRHLRRISKQHHAKVMDFVTPQAFLECARRIGLAQGKTLIVDEEEELFFANDLAIYTAPPGRSRAIDRYARSVPLAPGSDEARVLEAMCGARFTLVRIERRHEVAGLIVSDIAVGAELWLMDEGFEKSLPDRCMLATRLYKPDGFWVTAGVSVPLEEGLVTDAFGEVPHLLRKQPAEAVSDRRFAEALYRVALAGDVMERVAWQDPTGRAD
jgi:hypothetical protein